jgi:hypothetical protein
MHRMVKARIDIYLVLQRGPETSMYVAKLASNKISLSSKDKIKSLLTSCFREYSCISELLIDIVTSFP